MAEPDGAGGIKQAIRVFLDKASLATVAAEAKASAQNIAQQIADAFKLVKIPDIQPLDPSKTKAVLKEYKKDVAGATAELKRLQMVQQMNNTTLTASGRVLAALGVNVYKTSYAYQTLVTNIKNLGSGIAPATASLRNMFSQMSGSWLGILKSFAGQLGIAFSAYRLIAFAKSAVETAGESQAAWARLSSTLADFGIPLSSVQGDVEKMVASQAKLGVKSQESVEVLSTLVQLTGDYKKSLAATSVVIDLTIARHMGMEQAAKAVGRAIEGDTLLLSRQGIYLDKNRDAIEQLSERMRGELQARAGTLAGKVQIVSSAYNDMKIAIGNALQAGSGNMATKLVDILQSITVWVKANQDAFDAWMGVFKIVGAAVFYILRGFVTSFKLVEAAIGLTAAGFVLMKDAAVIAGSGIAIALMTAANLTVKAWDFVFKTHHDGLEKMIKEAKGAATEANTHIKSLNKKTGQALTDLFVPEDKPAGAQAPDFAIGTAGKINARVQQRWHTDVSQLGNIALHGREDAATAAVAELNKKLQEQEQIVTDLSANDELRGRSLGAIKDAESNIATIKRIQLEYEKKMNDNAAQRRKDAATMQEIERLGRVSRQAESPADQAAAMQGLVRIQKNLTAEQAKTVKYSERYFVLQNMIDQVEHQRDERSALQDKEFKDRIDRLHDQILLHVDEAKAADDLAGIMKELNLQMAAAVTVEDRLKVAQRQRMVEQAMHTTAEGRQAKTTQFEVDLGDPAKRGAAEKGLLAIDKQITSEIFRAKTLNMDINDLLVEQKNIRDALSAIQHTSVADIRKEIGDARVLAKSWGTRKSAAEMYQKVIDDINSQLDGHIALTDEERKHLQVLLDTATQGLNHLKVITGSMVDEFKQLWEEVGQSFIDNVSTKISDSWTRAAELMLGDLHDIKKAATTAFQGMGKAFASEIKAIATLEAKKHIAEAVSEGAEAIKALANHNWHAAAMHAKGVGHQLLAAAKWSALAGAAGNIGGQGVSGASGSGGNSGTTADEANKQGPIIYLKIDGMDPNNPKHQELAGATIEKWQETAHGAQIAFKG